jgi:enoyl-CoA hydratase
MTADNTEPIRLERGQDGVAVVTLNRPEHGNSVVPALADALMDALATVDRDFDVRTLILTGAGRQFCAGADLGAFQRHLEHELPQTHEPFNARLLLPVAQRIAGLRVPVIAALNGAATAGGLDLALACDIRIASSRARMGETYINLGLPPGTGGAYFLPRLVGSGAAAELALTGELIDAQRALELGLVNRVVEPERLLEESHALAAKIAAKPRLALEATKQALRSGWHSDLAGALGSAFWSVAALQHTGDTLEGVRAARERRAPRYNLPRSS